MRKPRSDSKLLSQLTEEQQAQLSDWLLSGMPYHAVIPMVKEKFAVDTSLGALSSFWDSYCSVALIARRRRAVTTADEVAEEAQSRPGQWDKATIDALKQQAFELSISPGANPGDVKKLFSLVLKARDQDLSEERIKLEREKFEYDAAKAALKHVKEIRDIAMNRSFNAAEQVQAVRRRMFGKAVVG